MPGIDNGLFTTGDNISATNPGHIGKFVGLAMHFNTRQQWIAACTSAVAGQYPDGQSMTVSDEAGVPAVHVWRKSLGHALTVRFPCGAEVVLGDMDKVVRLANGWPEPGLGVQNEFAYDPAMRTVYRKGETVWEVEKSEWLLVQASRSGDVSLGAADRDSVVRLTGTNVATMTDVGQQFVGIKVERVAAGSTTPAAGAGVTLIPRHTGALAAITNDGSYYRFEPSGTAGKYYVTRVGN